MGVREGYFTGRGRVIMRARTHFEDMGKGEPPGPDQDEIPYQVNKKTLIEKIAELVNDKEDRGYFRYPRRVGQVRHAHRDRTEARRSRRGHTQ